ncbi:MAG: rod shape-determining protein RodA [Chlorobi bacterium]|nr:rod shape-determining protein RodA [Chlorobiota bacterium]
MATESKLNQLFRTQQGPTFDIGTLIITLLLITAGLISIYSATYDAGSSNYFYKQLFFAGLGLVGILTINFLPEKWIKASSVALYIIALLMLVAVLFFGREIAGTKGWFRLWGIGFQPAEFAKIATIMAIASYLNRKGIDIKNLRDLLIVMALALLPASLVMMQPDVGSASVLVVILFGALLWSGFNLFLLYVIVAMPIVFVLSLTADIYFQIFFVVFAITAFMFRRKIILTIVGISIILSIGYFSNDMMSALPKNSQTRINMFIHPEADPLGKGYNVMQSVLAVGSGGVTGKGYLQGTQTQLRYIPEQRTDFIFCVPTEEFGFIGGSTVLILMILLIFRAIRVGFESGDKFRGLLAIGIATTFLYHTIINIGMVIRLMPVMGIPLPFMSYGGTALLVNMTMVGLLMNIYRANNTRQS